MTLLIAPVTVLLLLAFRQSPTKGGTLMRSLMIAIALGCGLTLAAHAQSAASQSKDTDAVKTVTFTGCVADGTETKTYILNKIVPTGQSTTQAVGTSGIVPSITTTTFELVPAEKVEIKENVGHRVEVTGVMMPAGETKTQVETKVDRDKGPDTKSKEETKSKSDAPQFRVTSIKSLADSCQ